MAKAAKTAPAIDFAALNLNIVGAEKRSITNENVARPTREIIAEINAQARQAAWAAVLSAVSELHGNPVEAKGANWDVNDDEAARAIRVNYNLIQPDYYGNANRKQVRMTLEASQDAWRQICEMLEKPEPVFSNDETADDEKDAA